MTRAWRDYLADMLHYSETAVRLVAGMTAEEVAADERTRLALERACEIIGEAASKVPPEVRARYPDVPWKDMAGARNRLAHGYLETDSDIIYRVGAVVLPEFLPRLREIVANETGDRPDGGP
jgi:uncharacterized protein with HEPN domain